MSTHFLYTYGTLQVPAIFRHIVGRTVEGHPTSLDGYARYRVRACVYPAIVEELGGRVPGLVYGGLSTSELERLDNYEGELYERRLLPVLHGSLHVEAYVYVLRADQRHLLSTEAWDLDSFTREHLSRYLQQVSATSRAP